MLTPQDITNTTLKSGMGYKKKEVEAFLLEIQKILIASIDIPCLNLRDTKGFIKVLHYCGKNIVSKIMNYLYKDATIYGSRKYNKFNEIFCALDERSSIETVLTEETAEMPIVNQAS